MDLTVLNSTSDGALTDKTESACPARFQKTNITVRQDQFLLTLIHRCLVDTSAHDAAFLYKVLSTLDKRYIN